MTNPDQRCGTCRHYDAGGADYIGDSPDCGLCAAPVPDAVMVEGRDIMQPQDGTTCPCWAKKLPAPPEIEQ